MSHIVIVSDQPLFCEALSDVISRELRAEVTTMENVKSLQNLPSEQVDLVVTTLPLPKTRMGPALYYPAGEPRRIHTLLADIAAQLADKTHAATPLGDTIFLQEKNRKLERADTGTMQELTEKEQALLLFIRQQGEATREDILRNVWGLNAEVTTHTLETHIYRLRQKWRELSGDDCIVATEKGYRWHDHVV